MEMTAPDASRRIMDADGSGASCSGVAMVSVPLAASTGTGSTSVAPATLTNVTMAQRQTDRVRDMFGGSPSHQPALQASVAASPGRRRLTDMTPSLKKASRVLERGVGSVRFGAYGR